MKSFLLNSKTNKPTISWSMLKNNTFFEGEVPNGFSLAVCPSDNIIILDCDVKNGKNAFNHIPIHILGELEKTFNYYTGSRGRHYFLHYTGEKTLLNRATKFGLDLRIGAKDGNAGGYVRYQHSVDIRECVHLIKETSNSLNLWLESLFSNNIENE